MRRTISDKDRASKTVRSNGAYCFKADCRGWDRPPELAFQALATDAGYRKVTSNAVGIVAIQAGLNRKTASQHQPEDQQDEHALLTVAPTLAAHVAAEPDSVRRVVSSQEGA